MNITIPREIVGIKINQPNLYNLRNLYHINIPVIAKIITETAVISRIIAHTTYNTPPWNPKIL